MSCKKDMRTQILARLSEARFPIRDPGDLLEAWGTSKPEIQGCGEAPLEAEEIVGMLSPRDYLFTNPGQVADLVVGRADCPSDAGAPH